MSEADRLAIVLTGGGARAAYQVGFIRCLARHAPQLRPPVIITGVSAGAINAAFLACHQGSLQGAADELTELWHGLTMEKVFRVDMWCLMRNVLRWGAGLVSGGRQSAGRMRGFLDTTPLMELLQDSLEDETGVIPGITSNLESDRLQALAITAIKYSTGQTVSWIEGRNVEGWQRPQRIGVLTRISAAHVLASASLPLLFPAQKVEDEWFGDGGVRLLAPLAPAIHLGATRILAVSTRYQRSLAEASRPEIEGYPPPAVVLGTMLNAVFLDSVDHDAMHLNRINRLLDEQDDSEPLSNIDLRVLRPSVDLGRLAADYEVDMPRGLRFLTRGLGTRQTRSPDFLSLLMFQPDYLRRLIEIGEEDAEANLDTILDIMR